MKRTFIFGLLFVFAFTFALTVTTSQNAVAGGSNCCEGGFCEFSGGPLYQGNWDKGICVDSFMGGCPILYYYCPW